MTKPVLERVLLGYAILALIAVGRVHCVPELKSASI